MVCHEGFGIGPCFRLFMVLTLSTSSVNTRATIASMYRTTPCRLRQMKRGGPAECSGFVVCQDQATLLDNQM